MSRAPEQRRDWRVSAILLVTWIVALILVSTRRDDIPVSMLAMATAFFILLIPAMNDLVRTIERIALGRNADTGEKSPRDRTTG